MAFSISFRRLVEVRVLHSFYLENNATKAFYELSQEAKAKRLISIDYDIRRDIRITPTEACLTFLKNHKIVFLPTFMGFVLAIEVVNREGKLKPKVNLPTDMLLVFEINIKNTAWSIFTNTKIKTGQSPLQFYWTNNDDGSNKILPSISCPLKAFDASKKYEMGEWVLKNNTPHRAQDNNGNWTADEHFYDYCTEADRRALARQCRFFPLLPSANIAEIVLTKKNDNSKPPFEAKWRVQSGSNTPLSKIAVDLSMNPKDNQRIPTGFYNLNIRCKDKNGTVATADYQNVALVDDINPSSFGVVELVQKIGLPNGQSLLNDDGSVIEGGRVFEIRLQNRITYWQYSGLNATIPNENAVLDNSLMTKRPYPLTQAQMPIDFVENTKLPSPTKFTIGEKENRYFTEIMQRMYKTE